MPASAMWGLSQASQPVSPGVKWGQSEQPVTALSSLGARLCWKGSQALAHLVLVVTAPEASVLSPHHRKWGHLNDTVAGRRSEQCLVNSKPLVDHGSLSFFLRFYLFIHDKEREREREAETQAEGEAASTQGARRGTRSRVPRITPQAEGGTKPLGHRAAP